MQNVCNICPQGSLVTEGCILIGKKSWKYPDVHKQECLNMFLWMVFMHCFMFVFIYLHIVFLSRCGLENISGCSLCKLSGWVNICFKIFLQLHCVPVATGSFHFPSVFHIFCQILVLLGLKLQNTLKNGGLGGEGGGRGQKGQIFLPSEFHSWKNSKVDCFCFGAPAASSSLTSHADYYTSAHIPPSQSSGHNPGSKLSDSSNKYSPKHNANRKYRVLCRLMSMHSDSLLSELASHARARAPAWIIIT